MLIAGRIECELMWYVEQVMSTFKNFRQELELINFLISQISIPRMNQLPSINVQISSQIQIYEGYVPKKPCSFITEVDLQNEKRHHR